MLRCQRGNAMPVIRVSDAVYRELQRRAQPFVDTPDTVLARLLGVGGGQTRDVGLRPGRARKPSGDTTPRSEYRLPILRALERLGGQGPAREVLRLVEDRMRTSLTPADREMLPSGQRERWRENAEFERLEMVKDGLLASGSPRGIWEITEAGREYLASYRNG